MTNGFGRMGQEIIKILQEVKTKQAFDATF
jgi:hypothetical protein